MYAPFVKCLAELDGVEMRQALDELAVACQRRGVPLDEHRHRVGLRFDGVTCIRSRRPDRAECWMTLDEWAPALAEAVR